MEKTARAVRAPGTDARRARRRRRRQSHARRGDASAHAATWRGGVRAEQSARDRQRGDDRARRAVPLRARRARRRSTSTHSRAFPFPAWRPPHDAAASDRPSPVRSLARSSAAHRLRDRDPHVLRRRTGGGAARARASRPRPRAGERHDLRGGARRTARREAVLRRRAAALGRHLRPRRLRVLGRAARRDDRRARRGGEEALRRAAHLRRRRRRRARRRTRWGARDAGPSATTMDGRGRDFSPSPFRRVRRRRRRA